MTLPHILNPITRQLISDSYEGEGWVGRFIYRYDINHDQLSYRVVLIRGFNSKLKKVELDIFISETCEWRKSMVVFCPGKFHCRGVSYIRICFSSGIVSMAALLGLIHTTMLVIVSLSTQKIWECVAVA